jgi:hypothetical protein
MTAVTARDRDDLDDVEDVALLVALSETFSFEPLRLVEDAPAHRRRLPRVRLPRLRLPHLRLPHVGLPHLRLPRLRLPRRRLRHAVYPIVLEGPRRVPIEVLHLSRPHSH